MHILHLLVAALAIAAGHALALPADTVSTLNRVDDITQHLSHVQSFGIKFTSSKSAESSSCEKTCAAPWEHYERCFPTALDRNATLEELQCACTEGLFSGFQSCIDCDPDSWILDDGEGGTEDGYDILVGWREECRNASIPVSFEPRRPANGGGASAQGGTGAAHAAFHVQHIFAGSLAALAVGAVYLV